MLHATSKDPMGPVHTAHLSPWQERGGSSMGSKLEVKATREVCVGHLRSHKDRGAKSTYVQTTLLALAVWAASVPNLRPNPVKHAREYFLPWVSGPCLALSLSQKYKIKDLKYKYLWGTST